MRISVGCSYGSSSDLPFITPRPPPPPSLGRAPSACRSQGVLVKLASLPFSRSVSSNSRHMRSRRLSNQSRAACCSPSRVIMPDKVPSAVMLHSTRCPLRRQYSRSENPPSSECESEAPLDHAHRRAHLHLPTPAAARPSLGIQSLAGAHPPGW